MRAGRRSGSTASSTGRAVATAGRSAVWSRDHELADVALSTHGGWVQAATPIEGDAFLLVSIHVELDKDCRSVPMLHRILSDLTPILEQAASGVVLGGDLNADVGFDEKYGTRRHAIAFERIEEFGLWHCNRLIPPGRRREPRMKVGPQRQDVRRCR